MRAFTVLFLAQALTLSHGQLVDPYPMSDCSSNIAGLELQCPGTSGCCKGGASCCAGGCCPLISNCINIGTPNEGCCPFSDTTNCGFGVTKFPAPACTAVAGFKPDKLCVGASGSWHCPAEDGCDLANGSCFPYPKQSCTYDVQPTTPVETTPVETPQSTPPVDTSSVDTSPADTSTTESPQTPPPVETTSVDTTSVDTTPVESTPTDTAPVDTSPVETPLTTATVGTVGTQSADTSVMDQGSSQPTAPAESTAVDSSPASSGSGSSPTASDAGTSATPPPSAANHMARSVLLGALVGASVLAVFYL